MLSTIRRITTDLEYSRWVLQILERGTTTTATPASRINGFASSSSVYGVKRPVLQRRRMGDTDIRLSSLNYAKIVLRILCIVLSVAIWASIVESVAEWPNYPFLLRDPESAIMKTSKMFNPRLTTHLPYTAAFSHMGRSLVPHPSLLAQEGDRRNISGDTLLGPELCSTTGSAEADDSLGQGVHGIRHVTLKGGDPPPLPKATFSTKNLGQPRSGSSTFRRSEDQRWPTRSITRVTSEVTDQHWSLTDEAQQLYVRMILTLISAVKGQRLQLQQKLQLKDLVQPRSGFRRRRSEDQRWPTRSITRVTSEVTDQHWSLTDEAQ